jgi:hypothetical protein
VAWWAGADGAVAQQEKRFWQSLERAARQRQELEAVRAGITHQQASHGDHPRGARAHVPDPVGWWAGVWGGGGAFIRTPLGRGLWFEACLGECALCLCLCLHDRFRQRRRGREGIEGAARAPAEPGAGGADAG